MNTHNTQNVSLPSSAVKLVFFWHFVFIYLPLVLLFFFDLAFVINSDGHIIVDQERLCFYVLAGLMSLVLPIYMCLATSCETTPDGMYVRVLWLLKRRFIKQNDIRSISRLYPLPVCLCIVSEKNFTDFQMCLIPVLPLSKTLNDATIDTNGGESGNE